MPAPRLPGLVGGMLASINWTKRLQGDVAPWVAKGRMTVAGADHEIVADRVRAAKTCNDISPPLVYWRSSSVSLAKLQ